MALYDNKCPSCGETIPQRSVPARQSGATGFPCPACGKRLRTARLPARLTVPLTLTLSVGLCFFFALRGLTAIAVFLLVLLPFYFIVYMAVGLVFPPLLEIFPTEATTTKQGDRNV